jgi:antitoxin component of MazEF toxin-antitoxin module
MATTVATWGNSLAVRLPRNVVAEAQLREGARLEVRVEGARVVLTPARLRYQLEELLAQMKPGRK